MTKDNMFVLDFLPEKYLCAVLKIAWLFSQQGEE